MNNKFKCPDGTIITLAPDVDPNKFLANKNMTPNAGKVMDLFLNRGYEMSAIPGSFIKMLSASEKELSELPNILDEIDKLNLKEIFNANLEVRSFTPSFLNRVKEAMEKGIPFVNPDNTFIKEIKTAEDFKSFTVEAKEAPNNGVVDNPSIVEPHEVKQLDVEDLNVKSNIISRLGEINSLNSDSTLTFIISSIIANLDSVLSNDNKAYRILGERHIVESALQGVALTPEMQNMINNTILAAFPENNMNMERGI